MSLDISFTGSIEITNPSTSLTTLEKTITDSFTGQLYTLSESVIVNTSPSTITLPNGNAQVVYIKNNSSSFNLTVTWTPRGGISATVLTVTPGGMLMFIEPDTSQGITALSLVATGAALVEYLLAG